MKIKATNRCFFFEKNKTKKVKKYNKKVLQFRTKFDMIKT